MDRAARTKHESACFSTVGKLSRKALPFGTALDLIGGFADVILFDEAGQLLDTDALHLPSFNKPSGLLLCWVL